MNKDFTIYKNSLFQFETMFEWLKRIVWCVSYARTSVYYLHRLNCSCNAKPRTRTTTATEHYLKIDNLKNVMNKYFTIYKNCLFQFETVGTVKSGNYHSIMHIA